MQIFVATVVGLCLWIILWAFDVKALDGFLLTIAIVLSATVVWMAAPFVRNMLKPWRAAGGRAMGWGFVPRAAGAGSPSPAPEREASGRGGRSPVHEEQPQGKDAQREEPRVNDRPAGD